MTNLLSARDLSIKYGKTEILSQITFDVEMGDYIGIVGPNGSGKTTLMKALLSLIPLASGSIDYAKGENPKKIIGYLPQKIITSDVLFPAKVSEIVSIGLLSQKRGLKFMTSEDHSKVNNILDKLQIGDLSNRRIGDLSGGQQQRVLLARAMVNSPKLLILDEPTSALDPKIREDFYQLIQTLNQEEGITVMLVSHDISSVGQYTKKMMYIDRKLVFYGNYESFCQSSEMTKYFGYTTQHQYCWRHTDDTNITTNR